MGLGGVPRDIQGSDRSGPWRVVGMWPGRAGNGRGAWSVAGVVGVVGVTGVVVGGGCGGWVGVGLFESV